MSDKKKLLDQYKESPSPDMQSSPTLVKADMDYSAVVEWSRGNKAPRFMIVASDGTSHLCSYMNLVHGKLNPSFTLMTLPLPGGVFILEGVHLNKVRDKFLEERIKELHAFNPQRHKMPEDGEPIIEKLTLEEYQS